MSYAESRNAAQLDHLRVRTLQFVQRWHGKPPGTKRRTLFLFPGGMGSNLLKARTGYVDNGPPIQKFSYDMIWLTLGSLLGDALECEMVWNPADQIYRDVGNRIVIADGSAELLGIDPYVGFTDWCEANDIDWFTFGWDWRRPVSEAAAFFASEFLPMFQTVVKAECGGVDPLADYIVLGHSEGGMVVNAMLRAAALPAGLTAAIAVASPFYGYGGQIHRWFEGDSMFFLLDTMDVIRVISSLPGLYALPFLDHATWTRDRVALGQDAYPLLSYPSVGNKVPVLDVDPFVYSDTRYPTGTGFDEAALGKGFAEYIKLSEPMVGYQGIFSVLRGVRLNVAGKVAKQTRGGLTWGLLNPAKVYEPDDTPLHDAAKVPGDGTLPAWSTHLVGTPSTDIVSRDAEHAFLMEMPETQAAIARILGLGAPQALLRRESRPVATQAELDAFVMRLRAQTSGAESAQAFRAAALKAFENQRMGALKRLAARLIANIGRPPTAPPTRRSAKPKAKPKPKPGKRR